MEIIFIPKGKAEDLMNYSLDEIVSNELDIIKEELQNIDSNYILEEKNFGTAADWIMILAVLNSITTVFLLGDKINTGIEGWVKIGKRIKNILIHSDKTYVDINAAKVLALDYIANEIKIESIKLILESEIPLQDLSQKLGGRKPEEFISKPFNVYLFTFEINDHIQITLGIRSDGEIREHYYFNKNDHIPF